MNSDKLKYKLFNFFIKKQWIKNINHDEYFDANSSSPWIIQQPDINDSPLKSIELSKLVFIEAFHNYEFKQFKKGFFKLFNSHNSGWEEFIVTGIENSRHQSDSSSFHNLGEVNQIKLGDLKQVFQTINCSIYKTQESFFILKFDVELSEEYKKMFLKICNSKEETWKVTYFNSWKKILLNQDFIKSTSTIQNGGKNIKLDNLINGITSLFELFLRKYLKGIFLDSPSSQLPLLIYLTKINSIQFESDKSFQGWLNWMSQIRYSGNPIIFKGRERNNSNSRDFISIVEFDDNSHKKSNFNYPNNYLSLAIIKAFSKYLDLKYEEIKLMKHKTYKFLIETKFSNWNIISFIRTRKFRRLKYKLEKSDVILSIFEKEFLSGKEINFPFSSMDWFRESDQLKIIRKDFDKEIRSRAERCRSKLNEAKEIFRPISEFYSFNSGVALDTFAVILAILALIISLIPFLEIVKNHFGN